MTSLLSVLGLRVWRQLKSYLRQAFLSSSWTNSPVQADNFSGHRILIGAANPGWAAPYRKARDLLQSLEGNAGIEWRFGVTVLGILPVSNFETLPVFSLWVKNNEDFQIVHAHRILFATGCYERPLPFPGWTLPGVIGAGAIQTFLKSSSARPEGRIVLAGSHPLQLLVAEQLSDAGCRVTGVFFIQPLRKALRLLSAPITMIRNWRSVCSVVTSIIKLKARNIPVHFGKTPLAATGDSILRGVKIGQCATPNIKVREIQADILATCFGFLVSSELARQVGVETHWSELNGGWLIKVDKWMRTTVPGLFAAGELTGQWGSDAAMAEGTIAGLAIANDADKTGDKNVEHLAKPHHKVRRNAAAFAEILNHLSAVPESLRDTLLTQETILCRCEAIESGVLEKVCRDFPEIGSASALKLLTRIGMGKCQGRLCEANMRCSIKSIRDMTGGNASGFRTQFPVKPVEIGMLLDAFPPNSSRQTD